MGERERELVGVGKKKKVFLRMQWTRHLKRVWTKTECENKAYIPSMKKSGRMR